MLSRIPISRTGIRRSLLLLLWGAFVIYAFFLTPPNQPDTLALIQKLSTFQWEGINPLVIALFNLLGVLPIAYACLMLIDGHGQKLTAWPFTAASFGVGAFALLPYLALRQSNPTFKGSKSWLLKIVDSRWTGSFIALSAIGLLAYGCALGDWQDFVQQWQSSRFVHVMSLDFCLVSLLFPLLVGDDMTRRDLHDRRIVWAVTLIPLLGGLVYLALRPPIDPQPIMYRESVKSESL